MECLVTGLVNKINAIQTSVLSYVHRLMAIMKLSYCENASNAKLFFFFECDATDLFDLQSATVGVARLLGPNSRSRGPSGLGIPTCYNPLGPQLDPTAVREHQATGQPRRETGATCGAIANPNEQ